MKTTTVSVLEEPRDDRRLHTVFLKIKKPATHLRTEEMRFTEVWTEQKVSNLLINVCVHYHCWCILQPGERDFIIKENQHVLLSGVLGILPLILCHYACFICFIHLCVLPKCFWRNGWNRVAQKSAFCSSLHFRGRQIILWQKTWQFTCSPWRDLTI